MRADIQSQVDDLATRLRRRQLVGAFHVAMQTALLLRQVISHGQWTTVSGLIELIRSVGNKLVAAQPLELSSGNIVRRVLHLVREEFGVPGRDLQRTMYTLLQHSEPAESDAVDMAQIKGVLNEGIKEIIDELDSLYINVATQALEHIHSNEILMTHGSSRTLEEFFKAAGRKRKFHVIVAETAPSYQGQEMAMRLAAAGIDTTVIPDSAVFAMMSRVNKVVIGTHAVLANGGLLALSGTHMLVAAAKAHSTPVVVLTGMYKLSPVYSYNQDTHNTLLSPNAVLPYDDALLSKADIQYPLFDYVEPHFVNLFVTNLGGHPPSYIYRLLSEHYDSEDNEL